MSRDLEVVREVQEKVGQNVRMSSRITPAY